VSETIQLTPRWASPPGRTIQAILDQMGRPVDDLGDLLQVDERTAAGLLGDQVTISPDLAEKLAEGLGASPGFWANRYSQYQDDLVRVEADKWASSAPTELYSSLGWVARPTSWLERIRNLLDFFDVPDFPAWQTKYGPALAGVRYRKSSAFESNEVAVTAWLRRAQLQARSISLADWNADTFADAVEAARRLTWLKQPGVFLPRLVDACAAAGVALVLVRPPRGCPVSGASYTTENGAPMIVLSGRHLSDDHLWFTFFHEAAHVLLHPRGTPFVDNLDEAELDNAQDDHEREANEWAALRILSRDLLEECRRSRLTYKFVLRLASRAGVAPGPIVGQLQHERLVMPDRLNRLKRYYKWNGPNLETA
jgi:HTH-type transcriptional regulator/antitoxin HigA